MIKLKDKGFTLIELLVVIAIIGMMSSIVLASLNSARAKASDATIKADLVNLRAQAGLYYDNNNSYGTASTCTIMSGSMLPTAGGVGCVTTNLLGDTIFIRGVYAAVAASGNPGYANVSATDWAVFVPLKSAPTTYQCVDAAGASKVLSALPNLWFTVCP